MENRERGPDRSDDRFRRIFDAAPMAVAIVDGATGRITDANRQLLEMLDRPGLDVRGMSAIDLVHADDRERTAEMFGALGRGESQRAQLGVRVVVGLGAARSTRLTVSVARGDSHDPGSFVVQVEDMSAERAEEERLRHLALHDGLTGLANRVLFLDHLEQAQAAAERRGSWVAVLFADLDDFKDVNDSFGHAAGDDLLQQVAARLAAAVRPSDTASRFGGDEFVVCCADMGGDERSAREMAVTIAERVAAAVNGTYRIGGHPVGIRVSIGVALAAGGTESAEWMVSCADTAMYAAKRRGGDRIEYFESGAPRRAAPAG